MAVVADSRTVLKSAAGFALAGLLCYALSQLLNVAEVVLLLTTLGGLPVATAEGIAVL